MEIVQGLWLLAGADVNTAGFPVRRDAQDGLWPGQPWCQRLPATAEVVVLDGIHWRAVADEYNGHRGHAMNLPLGLAYSLPIAAAPASRSTQQLAGHDLWQVR